MRRMAVKDVCELLNTMLQRDSECLSNFIGLEFFINTRLQAHDRAVFHTNLYDTPVMNLVDMLNFIFGDKSLRIRPEFDHSGKLTRFKLVNDMTPATDMYSATERLEVLGEF